MDLCGRSTLFYLGPCGRWTWTEAVTLITSGHVPGAVHEQARRSFSEKELADLTCAVVTINAWNRLAISARTTPGTYQPAQLAGVEA